MKSKHPLLLYCADLHLTEKPPLARAVEGVDWLGVQGGYLDQLYCSHRQYDVPVAIAGDVFDKPTCSTKFMNWVLKQLAPFMKIYAIPGNHDLPNHRYGDVEDCAYWTLVQAERIVNVPPNEPVEVPGHTPVRLHGFPCGYEVKPLTKLSGLGMEVALVHEYIWTKSTGYPGAREEQSLFHTSPKLVGYDVAVFGDNHKGFLKTVGGCNVLNCGGFMRRKSDEKDYQPCVGLLYSDGSLERIPLDCSQDRFVEGNTAVLELMNSIGMNTFVEALAALGNQAINFATTIRQLMEREKVPDPVKDLILTCLDKAQK